MHKIIINLALLFAFIGFVKTSGGFDLDALKAKFLPAELVGLNFTAEEGKKLLKQKCDKVSGNNATVHIQAHRGAMQFARCISKLGNVTAIQEEIEIAKPIGELDEVFHKYCNKKSEVEECFHNLMPNILPCLNEEEKLRHELISRITSNLLGFICYKGGDQIALFYAEQGPECLEANKENINHCMNASFADYIPKNGIPDVETISNTAKSAIGTKECKDIDDFEKCVVGFLENCDDITPLNIIESVFKFVNNETQCHAKPKAKGGKNARSMGSTLRLNNYLIVNLAFVVMVIVLGNKIVSYLK